jgi:hypothetical protein
MDCQGLSWTHLAQDAVQGRAILKRVVKRRVS